jgi:hypothetical protein
VGRHSTVRKPQSIPRCPGRLRAPQADVLLFDIIQKLGRDEMGVVRKAKDARLGLHVTL